MEFLAALAFPHVPPVVALIPAMHEFLAVPAQARDHDDGLVDHEAAERLLVVPSLGPVTPSLPGFDEDPHGNTSGLYGSMIPFCRLVYVTMAALIRFISFDLKAAWRFFLS